MPGIPVLLSQNALFNWTVLCYLLSKQCISSSERSKFLTDLSLEKIKSSLLNQENEELKDNIKVEYFLRILSNILNTTSRHKYEKKYRVRSAKCKEYQTTCDLLITEHATKTANYDLRNSRANQISMYLQWHIEQWNTGNPKHRILFYNNQDEEISLIEKTRSEVEKYEKSKEKKQVIYRITTEASEPFTDFNDIAKLHAAYLKHIAQKKRQRKKIGPQSVDLNDSHSSSPDDLIVSAKRARLTTQTTATPETSTSSTNPSQILQSTVINSSPAIANETLIAFDLLNHWQNLQKQSPDQPVDLSKSSGERDRSCGQAY